MSVSRNRRQFSREFKLQVIREVSAGKSVAQAAREHEVHPNNITNWRTQLEKYGSEAFQGNGNTYTHEAKVAELERIIGQYAAENTLLKRALKSLEEARPNSSKPVSPKGNPKQSGGAGSSTCYASVGVGGVAR
jgi:transposase